MCKAATNINPRFNCMGFSYIIIIIPVRGVYFQFEGVTKKLDIWKNHIDKWCPTKIK